MFICKDLEQVYNVLDGNDPPVRVPVRNVNKNKAQSGFVKSRPQCSI